MAGYKPEQYLELLDLTKSGGSQLVRIQLDSLGTGMTNSGEIDETWARNWEQVFDKAAAIGIYILPVFSGWFDWNAGEGFSTWKDNAFNAARGGPAKTPNELLEKDSTTQKMWLEWVRKLVERWQGRKNILAWEIFSEVNLATGATEATGTDLVESAAAVIRKNDRQGRPVTASLADIGEWTSFYQSPALDFINTHPYPLSAQLDRVALEHVQHLLSSYKKPILIGESGLNADSPEKYPPKAEIGVRHAIWAELVSGSANGRSLYWEDGFGIFFPSLDWPWVRKYAQLELPAAKFVQDIDFSGFKPLIVYFPTDTKVWGAAVGSEKSVVGWFRDAKSEPPDWPMLPVISGQAVTIEVPGTAADWQVDFYNTQTGTEIVSSTTITRQGNSVAVNLPDFSDDIAFKMTPVPPPAFALRQGNNYFSLEGTPRFIFSRNLAGITPADYYKLLDLAPRGGSILLRMGTDNGAMGGAFGYGYTATGEIREDWTNNWEKFFDAAEAKGIYVLPTYTGWVNWNTSGYNAWDKNPFNSANGGSTTDPNEFFKKDSATQKLYLEWFRKVVIRWQKHKNIVAWEVITEVNNINGITEQEGVYLFEQLAKIARAADPQHRPIMASLADIGEWPQFYSSQELDILDYHPYPYTAELDLGNKLLMDVFRLRAKYHKPIIIGESGLNALMPDANKGSGKLPNAKIGLRHAIWEEMVSGVMNGRALWWEDSYGVYFSSLGWPYIEKYADLELPAARFVQGVDFTNFKPLRVTSTAQISGAAIGNEKMILGWFRDAKCEAPDFPLQQVITGQTVTLTVPGSTTEWKVDFYNTKTGMDIVGSSTITNQNGKVVVNLPDFNDDIAFKMTAVGGTVSTPVPVTTTDALAGEWSGTIANAAGTFSTQVKLEIQSGCQPGKVCGKFSAPQIPCSGQLFLQEVTDETFVFIEQNVTGAASCASGGYEYLQLLPDGSLAYKFAFTPGAVETSNGNLKRP